MQLSINSRELGMVFPELPWLFLGNPEKTRRRISATIEGALGKTLVKCSRGDSVLEAFANDRRRPAHLPNVKHPVTKSAKSSGGSKRLQLAAALLFFVGAVATVAFFPISWPGLVVFVLLWFFGLLCIHKDVFFQKSLWNCKGGVLGAVFGAAIAFGINYAVSGNDRWGWVGPALLLYLCVPIGVYLGYMFLDRKSMR